MAKSSASSRGPSGNRRESALTPFVQRALWTAGIAIVSVLILLLVIHGMKILFVTFGGVLFAIFLRALSDPLARRTPISEGWSLTLVAVLLFGLLIGGGVLLAPQVSEQYDQLSQRLPEMIEDIESYLMERAWGRQLLETVQNGGENSEMLLTATTGVLSAISEGLFFLLAIIFIGLFLAANPKWYADGFIHLMSVPRRKATRQVIARLGSTLRWWLVGRALAMLMVGVTTAIMLGILGVPLAVLVGLIVGLLTFVPYLGPLIGTIPVAFAAAMEDTTVMVWAIGLYAVIQHIEGYLIDPLIQQRVVRLPPAVTVVSQVLLGFVLGPVGITFATPLAAVGLVLTNEVYVKRILEAKDDDRVGAPSAEEAVVEGGSS